MNQEEKYFIRILSDYIHQRKTQPPVDPVNWDQITVIAAKQNLTGILYSQCKRIPGINNKQCQTLHEGFFSDVYLSVNSQCALEEVLSAFSKENISLMPFKGSVFCSYYPDKELRTMGDRDLLIHHEDREKSDRIMLELGYQKMVDNHAVWTYYNKNIMFEIHDVMFYEHLSNQVDYTSYFNQIWKRAVQRQKEPYVYEPDPQEHFIYLMAHTAKHVINSGMGFRAFLDMVMFCRYFDEQSGRDIDWDWIKAELIKLDLYKFTCTCFALCEYWFEIKMPFGNKDLDNGFIEKITEKIFTDGVFGLENEENAAAHSAKEIKRSEAGYYTTSVRLMVGKLFPPYRDMQLIPWYSWVDGRPYLLPAAWIYRWGYCIKNKVRHSLLLLFEPIQKKKQIKEREQFLSEWGL